MDSDDRTGQGDPGAPQSGPPQGGPPQGGPPQGGPPPAPPNFGQPPAAGQGYSSDAPQVSPQWQQPPPQQPYGPAPATNGMAIASMVLGILWLYWIGSILALVFGYIAKGQIDQSQGRQGGRGMAIAGIVLGWIGVGFLVVAIVFFVIFGVSTGFG